MYQSLKKTPAQTPSQPAQWLPVEIHEPVTPNTIPIINKMKDVSIELPPDFYTYV
ncbi:hypothetical protein [Solibacillus sp. FSL H8-0538]|uniref:hypothetical protein n=1 Tax=Solibacillus sp. FSL H8-0538 TaxID=2921400 RepID=UPI0030F77886